MRVFAAVIEWGDMDADTALILARSEDDRFHSIRAEVTTMLDAMHPDLMPQLRDALASEDAYGARTFDEWYATFHDDIETPWISTYEREV